MQRSPKTTLCPNCATQLEKVLTPFGMFWSCSGCRGRAIGVSLLRDISNAQLVQNMWFRAQQGSKQGKKSCISCRRPMATTSITVPSGVIDLDLCQSCHFIWFDDQEFEKIPKISDTHLRQKIDDKFQLSKLRDSSTDESPTYSPDLWIVDLFGLMSDWLGDN